MTGRFNQDLPENLQMAFKKAMNLKPQIITKQSINNRKVHEVNHIDITQGEDEVEINEAPVRNPNYKGKNYDPNYQQNRTKTNTNMLTNTTSSHHNTGNQGYGYNKDNQQDKPVNVSVILHGPVSKNSCTRSRRYYDICHSTEIGSSQRTTQQKENMQMLSTNSTPKRWKSMRQQ